MATASTTFDNISNVASIMTGIVALSVVFVRQTARSSRLERAKKILEECQKFLDDLNTGENSRIESRQSAFMENMSANLEAARRNYQELSRQAASEPGLLNELNYWNNISQKISELLRQLQALRTDIAQTAVTSSNRSNYNSSRQSGNALLPLHNTQSFIPGPSSSSYSPQRPQTYSRDVSAPNTSSHSTSSTGGSFQQPITYPPLPNPSVPSPSVVRSSQSPTQESCGISVRHGATYPSRGPDETRYQPMSSSYIGPQHMSRDSTPHASMNSLSPHSETLKMSSSDYYINPQMYTSSSELRNPPSREPPPPTSFATSSSLNRTSSYHRSPDIDEEASNLSLHPPYISSASEANPTHSSRHLSSYVPSSSTSGPAPATARPLVYNQSWYSNSATRTDDHDVPHNYSSASSQAPRRYTSASDGNRDGGQVAKTSVNWNTNVNYGQLSTGLSETSVRAATAFFDTGANVHISPHSSDFHNMQPIIPLPIGGIGGSSLTAEAIGTIELNMATGARLILHNVHYVPKARVRLISVLCLNRQGEYTSHFSGDACWVTDRRGAKVAYGNVHPTKELYQLE